MRALLVLVLVALACTSEAMPAPSPSARPGREPASLPVVPGESSLISALANAGAAPSLVAGSKMETFFGPALPARFMRTAIGALDVVWTAGLPPLAACRAPEGSRVTHAITPRGRPTREIDAGRPLTVAVYRDALVLTDDDRVLVAATAAFGTMTAEEPCDLRQPPTVAFGPRTPGFACGDRIAPKLALSMDPPVTSPNEAWRFSGCVLATFAMRSARVRIELPDDRTITRLIATNVPAGELVEFEILVRAAQVIPYRASLVLVD